jgi:hypothetical protein
VTAQVVTPGVAPSTKKALAVLNNTKPLAANIAEFNVSDLLKKKVTKSARV